MPDPRPPDLRSILVLLAPLLLVGTAVGQAPDETPSSPEAAGEFFGVVDVEIVNIDVWVTDDGEPVPGLEKDDFLVYRDGEPVEVTNFYAVADGRPVASEPEDPSGAGSDSSIPESGAPDMARKPPTAEIPREHRLSLVVYVDNYNIQPIERARVIPALRRFLSRTLAPGDRAMIVTADRSLEVRQPFTDELPMLFDALEEIEDDTGHAKIRRTELMEALHRIDEAKSPTRALGYARQHAEQVLNETGYTVDVLERLVDSLAGLPGRKALVHVSSGVPMLAGEAAFQAVAEKWKLSEAYAEIPRHDLSRSFEKVARDANAHRVVFYTLDAGGQRGAEFGGAEYAGFVSPRLRMTLDSVVPENLQAPLRLMAFETGGRAIVNRNEVLPALEEAARDFRSFYSLGIPSHGSGSARYHEIEVELHQELRRRGLELRHRSGYRSKSVDSRMRETLRSALLYSHEQNPLDLKVTLGSPEATGERTFLLPVRLRLPLRHLVLIPLESGKHELRLKLYVGAVGEEGDLSEIQEAPLGLRIDPEHLEAARREAFLHTHQILVSPGRRKIGVAVLDLLGQQSSIVTGLVEVGTGE
ncbi:MAG: VWA domain-containing protein [Thermoanaerobaculia bacterium]|nr:VWA domain-containing protein [Thermoanaerobaculia bacterium]